LPKDFGGWLEVLPDDIRVLEVSRAVLSDDVLKRPDREEMEDEENREETIVAGKGPRAGLGRMGLQGQREPTGAEGIIGLPSGLVAMHVGLAVRRAVAVAAFRQLKG
jgi:hypothetical protein